MGGGHLRSDPRLALRHDGEEEARHIDAALIKFRGHVLGQFRFAQHHRNDRVFAGQEIETGLAHAGAKAIGIVKKLGAQIIALLGQINGLDRGGNDGRRQGIGKEIGARALAHEIDDGFCSCDVTAGGAAQRLAQACR